MEKGTTGKDQILWYIGKLLDMLTDEQAGTLLTMIKKFYGKMGRKR